MLEAIAHAVRQATEEFQKCPDDNAGIARDLAGACAIASLSLYVLLRMHGFKPTIFQSAMGLFGSCHCWVEVDGKVVDVTATQFDAAKYPPVLIGERLNFHRVWDDTIKIDGAWRTVLTHANWPTWHVTQAPNIKRVWKIVTTANKFLKSGAVKAEKNHVGALPAHRR